MKKPDLTPLEAAEIMEESARQAKQMIDAPTIFFSAASQSAGVDRLKKCEMAYSLAASLLRAIAAGEYRQVVHGRWIESNPQNSDVCRLVRCSNCGETHIVPYTIPLNEWEKNRNYCGSCGARMDGKDDSHEPN